MDFNKVAREFYDLDSEDDSPILFFNELHEESIERVQLEIARGEDLVDASEKVPVEYCVKLTNLTSQNQNFNLFDLLGINGTSTKYFFSLGIVPPLVTFQYFKNGVQINVAGTFNTMQEIADAATLAGGSQDIFVVESGGNLSVTSNDNVYNSFEFVLPTITNNQENTNVQIEFLNGFSKEETYAELRNNPIRISGIRVLNFSSSNTSQLLLPMTYNYNSTTGLNVTFLLQIGNDFDVWQPNSFLNDFIIEGYPIVIDRYSYFNYTILANTPSMIVSFIATQLKIDRRLKGIIGR